MLRRALPSLPFVKSQTSSGSSLPTLLGVPVTLGVLVCLNHQRSENHPTSLATETSRTSTAAAAATTTAHRANDTNMSAITGTVVRTALVVGGTSGIGQGIALALAKRGNIAVTIAGRSEERGAEIVKLLHETSPQQQHFFQKVNAFDLKSIHELSTAMQSPPDLLVMTQGMATTQGYTPTVNGIDQKLQLHYFSRIYLANLLAPTMMRKMMTKSDEGGGVGGGGKILTVLSAGVHSKYQNYDSDFELKTSYSIANAANAAGFYSDAGFEALARQYPSITVAHAAPGMVNTNWGSEFPWYLRAVVRCLQPLVGRSLEESGELLTAGWLDLPTSTVAATGDDDGAKNFFLLDQYGKVISNGIKHSPEERNVIWTKTMALLPK
jgi:NAD(P)-dependent dehydrogenase (short-subunit alcohol dehydrogenase family)